MTFPHQIHYTLAPNADLTEDTRYFDGSKPVTVPNVTIDPVAYAALIGNLQNRTAGVAVSLNVRSCISGPEAAASTLAVVTVSGSSGWSISGNNLLVTAGAAGAGIFDITVTDRFGTVYNFPQSVWSFIAAGGADTMAPTVPTGMVITPLSSGLNVTFDSSSDNFDGATAPSGVASYNLYNQATKLTPSINAPTINKSPLLTGTSIGGSAPAATAVQTKQAWALTAAGVGFFNVPTDECEFESVQLSGDQAVAVEIDAYTSAFNFSTAGLMVRADLTPTAPFIVAYLHNGTQGIRVAARTTVGGLATNLVQLTTVTGPVRFRIDRSGNLFTVFYSQDGGQWQLFTTLTLGLPAVCSWGMVLSSRNVGVPCTAVFHDLNLTAKPVVNTTINTTVAMTLAATAVDTAGNESGPSIFILGTPSVIGPTGAKKWNPGHYMGPDTNVTKGSTFTSVKPETDGLNNFDLILGYMPTFKWGSLEPIQGELDVTPAYPLGYATGAALIQSFITNLTTLYNKPKRLLPKISVGSYTNTHPGNASGSGDFSNLPQYILESPVFGPAGYRIGGVGGVLTNAATFGWWGGDGNGKTYGACLHRPAVMARLTKLIQTLGIYFDGNPWVEAFMYEENSFAIGTCSANACPDFSVAAFDTNFRTHLAAVIGSWPRTNVVFENTFGGTPDVTSAFMDYQIGIKVLPGSTDTGGDTYVAAHGHQLSWGTDVYCGVVPNGGTRAATDYRPKVRFFAEVEGLDMGAFGGIQGGFEPADILLNINKRIMASHAIWCNLATGITTGKITNVNWPALAAFLNNPANALTTSAYPQFYNS